jgi:hypothetical protein
MIINNFNIVGVAVLKAEANPPLFVDADAPLSGAITHKLFQPVAGRDAQIFHLGGGFNQFELLLRRLRQGPVKLADSKALEDGGGFFIGECLNHALTLTHSVNNGKRYARLVSLSAQARHV